MVKKNLDKELEILFPERTIKTSLGAVEVAPFKFGHFGKVLGIINKYVEFFGNSDKDFIFGLLEKGEDAAEDLAMLATLSTGKEREWLDELPIDEAIDLFFKVFEVNASFFVEKIRMGSAAFQDKMIAISTDGESKLLNSSVPDTVGAT